MRQNVFKYSTKLLESLSLSALVFFSSSTYGAQPGSLAIAEEPLFLGFAVQPNVFFVTDDSGSMDWEFMTTGYWRWFHYDPDSKRDGVISSDTPTIQPPRPAPTDAVPNPRLPNLQTITSRQTNGEFSSARFDNTTNDRNGGRYNYIYNNSDHVFVNNCRTRGRTESCQSSQNHPLDVDWRGRSNGLNKLFYNADIIYEPWNGPCSPGPNSAPCENANFIDALSNPHSTQAGFGVSRNLETDGDANGGPFIYDVWIDDSGYSGNRPERGDNFNETGYAASKLGTETGIGDAPNEEVDLWDSHIRLKVSSTSIDVGLIVYNPDTATGLNETDLGGVIKIDTVGTCYKVLGGKASVKSVRDAIIASGAATAIDAAGTPGAVGPQGQPECRTIAQTTQNVANWYQYYRRRAYPVKNAIGEVIDAQPTFRFGLSVLNNFDPSRDYTRGEGNNEIQLGKGLFVPVPAVDETLPDHNARIKQDYFSFKQPAKLTPLRSALDRAGDYYTGGISLSNPATSASTFPDPIIYPCQKNFTILLTDGFWNSDTGFVADATKPDQDEDGVSNTLADVAYKYYIKDLNSTLANDVPRDTQESDLPAGGSNRTTIQHMVTFTVAFGIAGRLKDTDGDGTPDNIPDGIPGKKGPWGDPINNGGNVRIDDLWHAAYNSGGVFASASSPGEVTEKLLSAISEAESRLGTASAVALNSGTLNANSRLYQARFNSEGWAGNLFSVPIQDGAVDLVAPPGDDSPPECDGVAIGQLCEPEWNAALQLAARDYTTRNIFTMNTDSFDAVVFQWDALSDAQKDSLRVDPDAPVVQPPVLEPITRGQARLAYIEGNHTQEIDGSGDFRTRAKVADFFGNEMSVKNRLGDIVHSAPTFVGAPNFFYPESIEQASYAEFKLNNKDRTGIVYVGSNDGMLHGFNATTGDEEFAYIPGFLVPRLNKLTAPSYDRKHKYYVDGSPVVFDAYKGGWKTMLAAAMGASAQGVLGFDITDLGAFTTAGKPWEFTDNPRVDIGGNKYGDEDLGYTMGDVSFAKMNNNKWVVIFGNGFNNTEDDGNESSTGNGVIYIVDAFSGALIRKIDTGIGWAEDPTGTLVNGNFVSNERPNGIASVTPVDMDGDFKVDYLYAGDLFGNLWKIDVTSSSESGWKVAYNEKPFFTAKNPDETVVQPITSGVSVKRHPLNRDQVLVLFGTGKYMEITDAASGTVDSDIETFYGIWDDGTGNQAERDDLLQQKILAQLFVRDDANVILGEFRITSSAFDDPDEYAIDWENDKGWYMDLRVENVAEYGEEVVVTPIIRNNRVVFVTQTPGEAAEGGACSAGGTSWIMEVNANDGSRLPTAPFDVDGNGIIDENDVASYLGDDTITSGVRSKEGIVSSPGILSQRNTPSEFKYFSGTEGGVDVVLESATAEYRKRQSWRQLR